jgi:hypothetical protein
MGPKLDKTDERIRKVGRVERAIEAVSLRMLVARPRRVVETPEVKATPTIPTKPENPVTTSLERAPLKIH